MMMKHKKMTAMLFTALTAYSMFSAFPAAAEKMEVNPQNYYDLDESCVNIVAMRDDWFDPRLSDFRGDYDVELWNVKEGICDIQLTLCFPEELEIVPDRKGKPAASVFGEDAGVSGFTLDEEKHELHYTFHSDEPVQAEGVLFRITLAFPADVKSSEYRFKPEVQKLSGASGDIACNTVEGFVRIGGQHDDMRFDKGDMDLSHSVGIEDVQLLLKEYVTTLSGRPSALQDDHRLIVDVDEDGDVDIIDVQLLLKYCTERTALKEVTWEEILGKTPGYSGVHISNETWDIVRHSEKEA